MTPLIGSMPFVLMVFQAFIVLLWFLAVPLAKNDQKLSPAATEKPSSNFCLNLSQTMHHMN